MGASVDTSVYLDRAARARALMAEQGIDVLLLSVGHDLPYVTGYLAMPLERLTMLVLPVDGDATLVVPRLEAPRVVERPEVFTLRPWSETEDPVAIVAELTGAAATVAVGDQTWARFVVDLLPRLAAERGADRRRPARLGHAGATTLWLADDELRLVQPAVRRHQRRPLPLEARLPPDRRWSRQEFQWPKDRG